MQETNQVVDDDYDGDRALQVHVHALSSSLEWERNHFLCSAAHFILGPMLGNGQDFGAI